MRWAMYGFAFLCIALGVWPAPLYAMLPFAVDYVPYTGAHLVSQLQLLLFAGLAFFILLPQMKRTPTITLDIDWLYRRFFPAILSALGGRVIATRRRAEEAALAWARRVIDTLFYYHGPQGILARTWPTGTAMVWVVMLLALTLIIYYWQGAG